MVNNKYLVISNEGRIVSYDSSQVRGLIRKVNHKGITLGYDAHAGFNIPSVSDLVDILEEEQVVNIEGSVIDERRQSSDKPYSPTSVYVMQNGKILRRSIFPNKSVYVSKIPFEKEKILVAYLELLGSSYENFRQFIENSSINCSTLGDFLRNLAFFNLKIGLAKLPNVQIKSFVFDQQNQEGELNHPIEKHEDHDVLFIAQHKGGSNSRDLEFLRHRFLEGHLSGKLREKPFYVIVPKNPRSFFEVNIK